MGILSVLIDLSNLLTNHLPAIWSIVIATSVTVFVLFFLIYSQLLSRIIKISSFKLYQYAIILLFIFLTSISSVFLYSANFVQGTSSNTLSDPPNSKEKADPFASPTDIPTDCGSWDFCSDFKNDQGLENEYYRHVAGEPQKIILEGGPFANPPLYLTRNFSPFFKLKLDVQPLDLTAANIIIEAKELFQIFIGDNDYRSFAFLYWNQIAGEWERKKGDSKIYLPNGRDIDPRTQLSIEIDSRKKNGNAEINFVIFYKNTKGENDKYSFKKDVKIPSSKQGDFLTKIGVALYRVNANIPQAKFSFLGVDQK